ncbi:hypothetical protein BASA83_001456 [Batrachochytrium salamandrivorans]|nr:hypothetical protein BASA83_001456 [Batrachochytrium salamandrivorans]
MFGRPSKGSDKDGANAATQAFLPSGNALVYDKELKKWVTKGGEPVGGPEKVLAPPPIMKVASAEATLSTAPSYGGPSPTPGGGSSTTPGMASGAPIHTLSLTKSSGSLGAGSRRSARSRYVDVINPNAAKEGAPGVNLSLPFTFGMPPGQAAPKAMLPPMPLFQQSNGSTSSYYDDFVKQAEPADEVQPASVDGELISKATTDIPSKTMQGHAGPPISPARDRSASPQHHQPNLQPSYPQMPSKPEIHPRNVTPSLQTRPPGASDPNSRPSSYPSAISSNGVSESDLSMQYQPDYHQPSASYQPLSPAMLASQPMSARLNPRLMGRVSSGSRQGTPPRDM